MSSVTKPPSARRSTAEIELFPGVENTPTATFSGPSAPIHFVSVRREPHLDTLLLEYREDAGKWHHMPLWHSEYYALRTLLRLYPTLNFSVQKSHSETPAHLFFEWHDEHVSLADFCADPGVILGPFAHALPAPTPQTTQTSLAWAE